MTCGIALNIGSIVRSCVSTQKGTILKAIIVDFMHLLNRKNCRCILFCVCLCVCVHACLRAGPRIQVLSGRSLFQNSAQMSISLTGVLLISSVPPGKDV